MEQKELPSREDFEAYELVRQAGSFNMITQARSASLAADLPMDRYMAVLKSYTALMTMYPEVRSSK